MMWFRPYFHLGNDCRASPAERSLCVPSSEASRRTGVLRLCRTFPEERYRCSECTAEKGSSASGKWRDRNSGTADAFHHLHPAVSDNRDPAVPTNKIAGSGLAHRGRWLRSLVQTACLRESWVSGSGSRFVAHGWFPLPD